jgi:hypothetical protein
MPREANLFDQSNGSVVRAYLMLKSGGSANIPPMWIERSKESRKKKEATAAILLKKGRIKDFPAIEEWETAYKKECFYRGVRILLELERNGSSKL